MRPYQEVSEIVLQLQGLEEINNFFINVFQEISLMKLKGEAWIEEKDSSNFIEINDYLREKTSEILQNCISITSSHFEKCTEPASKHNVAKNDLNAISVSPVGSPSPKGTRIDSNATIWRQELRLENVLEAQPTTMDPTEEKRNAMFNASERSENTNQWDERKGNSNQWDERKGNTNQWDERKGNTNQWDERKGNTNQWDERKGNTNQWDERKGNTNQWDERKGNTNQCDERSENTNQWDERKGNTNQWFDLQKAINARFDKLKEEINARLQAASMFMSELQTRCDSLVKEQNDEKVRRKLQELKIEQMMQIQKDFNSRLEEILENQQLLDTTVEKLADLDPTSKRGQNFAFSEEFHCQATGQSDIQCHKFCLHVIGQHEQQISDAGETDLRKYSKECSRNPGHTKFIPVSAFGLYHLPEGHRDKDLYDLIKAASDLTVKVSVTMTSPQRPEFWPNTETPYALYNLRGTKQLRTGTGYINFIEKLTADSSSCDRLNQVWWKITMWTATNLIFDDIEAKKTTLRFFYDHKHSPEIEIKVFPIYSSHDATRDICWIQFDTCDRFIVERLQRAISLYNACKKVNNKYAASSELNRLVFIVSHPHGCYKQVSIGHWNDKFKMGCGFKLTHTASTCQGSVGARVHCVGSDDFWVYSGRSKSGLQYSCS